MTDPNLSQSLAWISSSKTKALDVFSKFFYQLEASHLSSNFYTLKYKSERTGIFSRRKVPFEISISLNSFLYHAKKEDQAILCSRAMIVHGIELKRESLLFSDWLGIVFEHIDQQGDLGKDFVLQI